MFVNGDELPGRPDIEKGYLHHTAEVIRMEIAKYIFNFTAVCKTLGLALLPALFIFYTAQEKFFN